MAYLVLVRHGESEWNAKGLWTGHSNIPLNEKGREESRAAGELLNDIFFDVAFISKLIRTKQTLSEILKALNVSNIPTYENSSLNERNYGEFTGKNKWEIKKEKGEEEFLKLRRSWNYPLPEGESLKDVYNRVVPYYQNTILPHLQKGENVLVVSSHAPLRALVKHFESISDTDISKLEIATGVIYIYEINKDGLVVSKEIRGERENTV